MTKLVVFGNGHSAVRFKDTLAKK